MKPLQQILGSKPVILVLSNTAHSLTLTQTTVKMRAIIIIIIIINSHIRHCTHTSESADVKVQNIFHGRNNITCSTDCKYRTAATLYTLQTWLDSGIIVTSLHSGENKDNKKK
jgi:hypothetical protein